MTHNQIKKIYKSIFKSFDEPCLQEYVRLLKDWDQSLPYNSTFFCIVNTQSLSYDFISKNLEACLGLNPKKLKEKGMPYFWSRLHPDDLEIWVKAIDFLMQFTIENIDKSKRDRVNYTWNYRFKNAEDVYVNIVQTTTPLVFDAQGKPIVGFANYQVLNHDIKIDFSVSVKLLNTYNKYETIYFNNFSKKKLFANVLTPRERDIIRLLAINYSSKEISEELNISPHTVDTHRRNILKKLNISSTGELVGMLKIDENIL